jgi:serine/threonine-protein kinase
MGIAGSYGLLRAAFVMDGEPAKMMPRSLARKVEVPETRFFSSEAEARTWLDEAPLGRGGDERAGFWIGADTRGRMMRLELWGLWDVSMANAFRAQCLRVLSALEGAPWVGLASHVRMPPQSDAVRAIQRETMTMGWRAGMTRAAVLVTSAVGRLQVKRITGESGAPMRLFSDEREARAWLAEA